jgi:Uma2 family endonuclease
MTIAPGKTYTPEDLLSLPDAVNYELVDGILVERKMGSESSLIAGIILTLLNNFIRGKRVGLVFGADCGYQCFPDAPDKVRKPDVSFVASGRLPGDRPPKGHTKIAPDLAVEVISPNDLAYEIEDKVAEYLAAGVKLVWVVNPASRTVRVQAGPNGAILRSDDTITGGDVLPGFECRVAEFFEI